MIKANRTIHYCQDVQHNRNKREEDNRLLQKRKMADYKDFWKILGHGESPMMATYNNSNIFLCGAVLMKPKV